MHGSGCGALKEVHAINAIPTIHKENGAPHMMDVVKEDLSSVGCSVSKLNSQAVVFSITREVCSSDFDNFKS